MQRQQNGGHFFLGLNVLSRKELLSTDTSIQSGIVLFKGKGIRVYLPRPRILVASYR